VTTHGLNLASPGELIAVVPFLFDYDLDDVAARLDEVRAAGLADYVRTRADPTALRVV
jgi:hypothetical protein